MPIAELFLGALINVLLDRLASRELLNFALHEGIDKLLEKWKIRLNMISQMLDDAEDKQLKGDGGVKSWLENLRNLVYDIDDLLDEFATKSMKSESKADSDCSKAQSLLPGCCFRLSPCVFMFDCKMRSEIKEMDGRLEEIITLKDILRLTENNRKSSAYPQFDKPDSTTNLTGTYFVSRDDEKKKILESLTKEDLKVIPIIGMPGVGKTALAQQVYNDPSTDCFNVKAWVCVSHDFDMLAITKNIILKIDSTLSCENKDLDWLQDNLKKSLSEKKFLVVLDDVWNRNHQKWSELLKPFKSGKKGSKIIVTSRDSKIAEIAQAPEFTLKVLSQDACTTLLAFHAFGDRNFDDHPNLKVIGQKIAEKCKGLPLAVATLGGLLSSNVSPDEWENILNNKIWDLQEESNNIPSALILSYFHLSFDLRRCFAYCAIFPNDYEIERDELIHWWIAEGLLKGKEGKNQWETGLKNFKELVCRSLLQKSNSSESRFLMHDLINDMAKLVAGATYFSSGEFEFKNDQNNEYLARHASFITSEFILPEKFKIYHGMKRLRSFISLDKPSRKYSWVYVSQKVLCDLLSALKYLRVLSLSNYEITEVPESIGKLRHLRHLNLSYTRIKTLPKSIVALYNLEALMLQGCYDLLELPKGIGKLKNLRFLDIIDTPLLKAMPLNVGNLVSLEMLSKFIVGTINGSRLKELKNLENLRGELCISYLHKVQEVEDANDANLCAKKGICRLTMQWSIGFEISRNIELEGKVLNLLRPHQNLENLKIFYYGGLEFPSWLGSPSHDKMVYLHLHGCQKVKALPSLGLLPSLKELYIGDLNEICMVGSEFYGSNSPFPSLITLKIKNMPLWKDWSHCVGIKEVIFPRLEHLAIYHCPMLIGRLPSQLSSLIKLEIYSCLQMDASLTITSLPSLNELDFRSCNEGVLKNLVMVTSLTAVTINDVVELTCLNSRFTSSLIKLEELEIIGCTKLRYLWQDGDAIRNLNCLKSLVVCSCPEFIYFVAEEGDIELPGSLETIKLEECVKLEKLPSKMHTLSSLRDLTVHNCPKLVSFPETGIPTSIISLNIKSCEMLRYLPRGLSITPDEPSNSVGSTSQSDMTSCLQDLEIYDCDSLPSSPFNKDGFLPMTLKRLKIFACRGVESLAEINLDSLESLQRIEISKCENLRSLPQGLHTLSQLSSLSLSTCPALEVECFPPLPPGISEFSLWRCPKIKSLPNQLNGLTSLQNLTISECESITRFSELPLQLQELNFKMIGCENMKQPVREWLTPLTSLQKLTIDGSVGGLGEEEDLVLPLPSSLLHLSIWNMGKVERLSSSLPPSLQKLLFWNWPKLRELPQDGLPPSLEILQIYGCPILKERCKKGTGCYWPLIREIPHVTIW
ncbi:hypothetical protein ACJRO7_011370 [Eucalyptus globulus]|uniref:Uncharacterized protein n=1 Tax=Eucalyptus globulus TaxID=34317 RepID=A0ABD3LIJ4_EUCGL